MSTVFNLVNPPSTDDPLRVTVYVVAATPPLKVAVDDAVPPAGTTTGFGTKPAAIGGLVIGVAVMESWTFPAKLFRLPTVIADVPVPVAGNFTRVGFAARVKSTKFTWNVIGAARKVLLAKPSKIPRE